MIEREIPPCPDELLRKLQKPAVFTEPEDRPPDPGTVWEVCAPDGELLLFLVVERFEADEADSFPFVRAVPLSDFLRPTQADDAIVAIESSATIYAAHCWLEGPVFF